jgi:MFS family permease
VPERFRRVLGAPHVRLLLVASLLARMPYGILGLATVLFVHDLTGSFASAGAVSAAYAISAGLALPVLGRVIDRRGQTRVLVAAAAIHGAGNVALVVLGVSGAPVWALAVAAAVAGAAVPPISPSLRGLWPTLLDDERLVRAALALDAIVIEVVFIGGPVLTAAVVAFASPQAALLTGAAFAVGGALVFAATPPSRGWRSAGRGGAGLGPLRAPGLRTLLLCAICLGVTLGAIEVGLPAFGVSEGSQSLGGLVIAAFAAGSAAGGVWYGAAAPDRVRGMYLGLAAGLPVGVALLTLAGSPLAMLLLAPIAGCVLAPLTAAENELAGTVAPEGTVTEAYAWVLTATVLGVAIGTGAGGALIDARGWQAALVFGAACGAVGALTALARRGTLAPARALEG